MATAARPKIKIQMRSRPDWKPIAMAGIVAVGDFVSVLLAVMLGFAFWALINPTIPPLQPAMLLAPTLSVAGFLFFGLYPGLGLNAVTQMRRLSHCLTLVYLLITAVMFMTKDQLAGSRGGFFSAWVLSLILTPAARLLSARFLASQSAWGVPVVVIGSGSAARVLIGNLTRNKILGYRPVVCVCDEEGGENFCEGVPVSGPLSDVEAIARTFGAQHAVVAIPALPNGQLVRHMQVWSKVFRRILIVPDMPGIASLWTEPRDLGGSLALEIQHKLLDTGNRIIKRASDVLLSGTALLISAPLVFCAALVIKHKSPGPAFYTQLREGKDGRAIRIRKLRSMHLDAESMLQNYLSGNEEAAEEWKRFYKLKNDPRIIPGIGRFLRRASIDELPQFWNVFKGEMSLVGPRPFPAYHNLQFDPEFRNLRLQVTPGLTGLWQVSARSDGDLKVQEAMDAYYIRNWSLWLDAYILLCTIRAVFLG